MIYYALSMGVLGSHNCHLVRIFWQIGRINLVGRLYQQTKRELWTNKAGGRGQRSHCVGEPARRKGFLPQPQRGSVSPPWATAVDAKRLPQVAASVK